MTQATRMRYTLSSKQFFLFNQLQEQSSQQ